MMQWKLPDPGPVETRKSLVLVVGAEGCPAPPTEEACGP